MRPSDLLGALATAVSLPGAHASWRQFNHDGACADGAHGGTGFDCANHDVFGSGGAFVKCHSTVGKCLVRRCGDRSCSRGDELVVPADKSCHGNMGAGPWYKLYLVS